MGTALAILGLIGSASVEARPQIFYGGGPLGGGYIVGTAPALVLKAANFAAKVHKGQVSEQDETIPFINHAIGIADILANVGKETDPVLLQASILHDSVEYTDTTIELLRKEFGAMVAHLVAEVTPKEDGACSRRVKQPTFL